MFSALNLFDKAVELRLHFISQFTIKIIQIAAKFFNKFIKASISDFSYCLQTKSLIFLNIAGLHLIIRSFILRIPNVVTSVKEIVPNKRKQMHS